MENLTSLLCVPMLKCRNPHEYAKASAMVSNHGSELVAIEEDMVVEDVVDALIAELQAFKSEYTNAQLECNAADERAKLLASEVIGLEEKALRLRSSELKLEKQLENAQAEISSYRGVITREQLQYGFIALLQVQQTGAVAQHMKGVYLSPLLSLREKTKVGSGKQSSRASSQYFTGFVSRYVYISIFNAASEDPASNSPNPEINDNDAEASSSSSLVPETRRSSLGVSPANIPHDQMRMIENINALISEVGFGLLRIRWVLALEKEELIKSLSLESSECSRMKEINKELSRKLEVQTQRLELLTAQSMVHENISTKQPDSRIVYENTQYADEGDEGVGMDNEAVSWWTFKKENQQTSLMGFTSDLYLLSPKSYSTVWMNHEAVSQLPPR
ncbi:hypothetical protein V8G54_028709 [Vigna mungo]|uniref:Uncharacterized protein n=1 Tax=Vigna mungo TaxID=3915 RepID=A0AAQ3RIF3_VIGMU